MPSKSELMMGLDQRIDELMAENARLRAVNDGLVAALDGAIFAMDRMNDASDEGGLLGDEYDACCAALKLAKG